MTHARHRHGWLDTPVAAGCARRWRCTVWLIVLTAGLALVTTFPLTAQTRLSGNRDAVAGAILSDGVTLPRKQVIPQAAEIRVIVRPYEQASIGAEINARIVQLPQREGDHFRKGDRLIAFDCRKLTAERDAAQATRNAQAAALKAQQHLQRYQAAGWLSVEQSRYEVEKWEAEVRGLEVRLSSCTIDAPFDGRVVEKLAQVHEIAQPNQPLIKIINAGRLELVLMIPSAWLPRVSGGQRFRVRFDETGEVHAAVVVQSTGLIDPISQSARLIAELVQPSRSVLPGMSGAAILDLSETTE